MPKFFGKVGYKNTDEIAPGVYSGVVEKKYYGDILTYSARNSMNDRVVGDFSVTVTISIIADEYALNHFAYLEYIEYMGSLWQIASATPAHPRIQITLGGLYNGETP